MCQTVFKRISCWNFQNDQHVVPTNCQQAYDSEIETREYWISSLFEFTIWRFEKEFHNDVHKGTDTAIMTLRPEDENYEKSFVEQYKREYGFLIEVKATGNFL